ncbi:ATPase inhibitor, mitochondrial-like [Phyllostomus discolor]|uniref:ATPase inhibitor, mitochondrial-like n=1 Tax=Phyllostomus discolor TaxID=89673 RepID=A0A7E6CW23_9CHIR|nr:ATPase inhibitor, mitochondrial-like [Phyllostomus discolor]
MAVTVLAARVRLGVWGMMTMQACGFSSEKSENVRSGASTVREVSGAFRKKEQAEEEQCS